MKVPLATLIIIASYVQFCSCSKSENDSKTNNAQRLMGKWQWNISRTGWGGTSLPGADSTILLSFSADSTYTVTLNNQVKYNGRFSTSITTAPNSISIISFASNLDLSKLKLFKQEIITGCQNDSLTLYDYGIADGSIHYFTLKR